uniref:Serine peptidase inhibitor, Kazal type 13 n=1 Tax=Jaculus jaculus TaxID=51337 RepID=A0A8C5L737_JACJA
MISTGCSPYKIMFILVFSNLVHTAFSAFFKPRNNSKWPKPPCKIYYPVDPLYEANCPDVESIVCASNGVTYKNECFFCIEQWEFGFHIEFSKYGRCD